MDPETFDTITTALASRPTLDPCRVRAALALHNVSVADIAKAAQRCERMTRKVLMGEKTSARVLTVFRVTIGERAWQFVTGKTDALWAVMQHNVTAFDVVDRNIVTAICRPESPHPPAQMPQPSPEPPGEGLPPKRETQG